MAFAGTPGPYSGRIARLYLNWNSSSGVGEPALRSDSPAGTFTNLLEIGFISGDNYSPGKKNYVEAEVRSQWQKFKLEGASDLASLKFSYMKQKGTTDAVWEAIKSIVEPGSPAVEIFICDDDVSLEGCTYDRGFFVLSKAGEDRDLGKIVTCDIEGTETTHFEEVDGNAVEQPILSEVTPAA